jgi:hypothetical protein
VDNTVMETGIGTINIKYELNKYKYDIKIVCTKGHYSIELINLDKQKLNYSHLEPSKIQYISYILNEESIIDNLNKDNYLWFKNKTRKIRRTNF